MERKYVIAAICGGNWEYAGYQRDELSNLYVTFLSESRAMEFPSAEAAKSWYHSVRVQIPEECRVETICVQEKNVKYTYKTIELFEEE